MQNGKNTCPVPRRPLAKRKSVLVVLIVVVMHVLGFIASINALMSTRTAPGAIAWIVALNTFPYAALPAYLAFGGSKFEGYVVARREKGSVQETALKTKQAQIAPYLYHPESPPEDIQALERLAKMSFLTGNHVDLLIDGDATFRSIFEGIAAAEHYLLVQFYIVRDDTLGRELKNRLIQKAREGVRVYFLYDAIGSYRLPASYVKDLSDAGVQTGRFQSTRGRVQRFQINFRNHRKIVVADGRCGWIGGLNVGDEYLGESAGMDPWRDTHLLIKGPAVLGLQVSFMEDWLWATDNILDLDWRTEAAKDASVPVLIIPSGPADRFETASLLMQHVIHTANRRIWITSPYFVPDEGVMGALKLAALRGLDVRIVIPERPDNLLVYFAAYAFLGSMLDADIQIFRYHAGFLHGKAFLVDDRYVGIGTVNLDNRSFRLNFEITAVTVDQAFVSDVEQMFENDFARARKMSKTDIQSKPFWFRVVSRAAYLTAPVL